MAKKQTEFDPVKYTDDGKAQQVIWSTKSLLAAVDAINKGLPLKANPFVGKDVKLLKPDLVYRRTLEEQEDWLKCKEDKVYFGNKCHLKTPAGVQRVTMRDYQEDYLRLCNDHPFTIFLACRQCGKSISTAIDCLHEMLFNNDVSGLIVSKSGPAGIDLLAKIKDIYKWLPYHLKAGVNIWNQHKISFDNNSSLTTEPPSETAGVSSTQNYLILDEFAWLPMPPESIDLYYDNILPTVSQDDNAKVRIMSTQNGHNKFYKLWQGATSGDNEFAPFKVDWWQVPQLNTKTGVWEKRTEEWKEKMIRKMGSPESFYYMYGTLFLSSDKCIVSRECISKLHEQEVTFRELTEEEANNLVCTEKCKKSIYIKPDLKLSDLKDKVILILVDLAEGVGGDYTIFHFFEVLLDDNNNPRFSQVGYYRSNKTDLDEAALCFWLLCQQLFSEERYIASVELNTYGVLFENYLMQLNEPDYKVEWNWRFSVGTEFDYSYLIRYKKSSQDEELPGMKKTNSKTIPGIRWNSSNKPASCQLLKGLIEKDVVQLFDLRTIAEVENFEDPNGKGHYKASYGHDDIIMTCVQIPMVMDTAKFKSLVEDLPNLLNNKEANNGYTDFYSAMGDTQIYGLNELPSFITEDPTFSQFPGMNPSTLY